MKFVDYVTITVKSGKGGPGSSSFRREKYVPRGGPDGGDGGAGGSVILVGNKQLYTLLDLRYNRHHFADNGQAGSSAMKSGKDGEDIVLSVPVGTVARNTDSGSVIGEILEEGQKLVLAAGGKGGKGNTHFKSATRQAPTYHQPGLPGEEINVTLELKLLADVGLVGLPNAGKSTFVASVSAAKPKIADYPFTTLEPSLGVVSIGEYESFVVADIPGIIEGAHEGKGLGDRFLKHIERNAILLVLIPVTSEDIGAEYRILRNELSSFSNLLSNKHHVVAISKMDLIQRDEQDEWLKDARSQLPDDIRVFGISSVARTGLKQLTSYLWDAVKVQREAEY
ncbi:MAG: GTPase ObgE [Rhodothermales bacterium]|nr:GTPase ObgE [Rhodothermales bacterium]